MDWRIVGGIVLVGLIVTCIIFKINPLKFLDDVIDIFT